MPGTAGLHPHFEGSKKVTGAEMNPWRPRVPRPIRGQSLQASPTGRLDWAPRSPHPDAKSPRRAAPGVRRSQWRVGQIRLRLPVSRSPTPMIAMGMDTKETPKPMKARGKSSPPLGPFMPARYPITAK